MNNEWQDLPTMQDVARAQNDGWDIHFADAWGDWAEWSRESWKHTTKYRGRPRQPVKITVTSECWIAIGDGSLLWLKPDRGAGFGWKRFPAGDITGEVEE